MAPNKPKEKMKADERIERMKEARAKYSQLSKTHSAVARNAAISKLPVAQAKSKKSNVAVVAKKDLRRPIGNARNEKSRAPVITEEDDFKSDPNSLSMIANCKVTIPTNSVTGRQSMRPSVGGRNVNRVRPSIANEPRQSLLPLGINVFEANEYQRNEVRDYLQTLKSSTPGKQKATNSVFGNTIGLPTPSKNTSFQRDKRIRFMEETIVEQRESADPSEIKTTFDTKTHHSPISDTSFVPTSILSSNRRVKKSVVLSSLETTNYASDFEKMSTEDLVGKLNECMCRISDVLYNRQLDQDKLDVINKAIESVSRLNVKKVSEALNETILLDNSIMQQSSSALRTPKPKKPSSITRTARPFEDIINALNRVEEDSPETNDDDKPKMNKRRSSRLSVKTKNDSSRVLFRRRSSHLFLKK